MSTTDPQNSNPTSNGTTSTSLQTTQAAQYASLKYNLSLALLVTCPIVILLPPRKLDLYTFGLSGLWLASANHASYASSGRSIMQRMSSGVGADLPTEKAREMQRRLREEKEARRVGEGEREKKKGVLERLWMGGETEDWKERRLKEEQEAIEQGKGYGDLIMGQLYDVWGVNKGKEDQETKPRDREEGKR